MINKLFSNSLSLQTGEYVHRDKFILLIFLKSANDSHNFISISCNEHVSRHMFYHFRYRTFVKSIRNHLDICSCYSNRFIWVGGQPGFSQDFSYLIGIVCMCRSYSNHFKMIGASFALCKEAPLGSSVGITVAAARQGWVVRDVMTELTSV